IQTTRKRLRELHVGAASKARHFSAAIEPLFRPVMVDELNLSILWRGQTMLRHLSRLSIFAGMSVLYAMPAHADRILAQTTFDSDLGGWNCSQPSALSWSASGGNPGGHALFTDKGSPQGYLIAPSSFLTGSVNYSRLDGKAYISWQHQVIKEVDARDN